MRALHPLRQDQAAAAVPHANAWVSASAGTGKTQVLSARVLRLLLQGAAPDRILCLTFTKAGAAEMQARIFDRLAHWVRAGDAELRADLEAIRAPSDDAALAVARTLFAHTLDARGGLKVQTLHAYAQSLLSAFPLEAGIAPGFEALADRDARALRGRILTEAIEAARDDPRFIADVGAISVARGEASLDRLASVLIGHAPALAALGPESGFEPKLRRAFGLPGEGTRDEVLADAVARLDHAGLRTLAQHLLGGPATASKRGDDLLCWLACAPAAQVAQIDLLCSAFHTKASERLKALVHGGQKADAAMQALADRLCDDIDALVERRRLLDAVDNAARYLRVGARLAAAYAVHKRRAGAIDYDDMIALAAGLLTRPGMSEWVRYKLDARIDHLLVDEAQDTNAAQWEIVRALAGEFFDGSGARDLQRTLFVVGDFKQAIFSFQGSDPRLFTAAQEEYRQKVSDALLPWRDIDLTESFRSVPAVLDVVAAVFGQLGHAALGLPDAPPPPHAARGALAGTVTLWPPLAGDGDAVQDERDWLPPNQIRMAHQLARQIAAWLTPATALWLPARGRAARPEDILVLVRSRGEFVQPLVGALHQHGVPVAGADRLRLIEPLAVQDCLALLRFVLQPGDDLTCATLLTSPFIGLDQDALFALAHGRGGDSLWRRVQAAGGAAAGWLGKALEIADFGAPYEFLETVLSGPLQGRAKLLGRLGEEAREALQAVLAQALAFEAANAPTLQGFLAWMEGQDTDIKRDPDAPLDAVRIMTVHGAKGLQAPVVVIADAARDLARLDDHVMVELDGQLVPVFHGGAAGKVGPIAAAAEDAADRAREEHWRLLYVALTRAEDLLFVGGALSAPRGDKPADVPAGSWYAAVGAALGALAAAAVPDAIWGGATVYRSNADAAPVHQTAAADPPVPPSLPGWARTPAPPEAQPPRPLSPSALAADDVAQPPPTPALRAAARRGTLLHALFERLPALPPSRREAAATRWLTSQAADLDAAARGHLAATALGIIGDPRFAALFGPDALAEAPVAAVVDGVVVAGTVDRLLVEDTRVTVVDFKTGSRVPADAASVEPYHLKQMAAYVAALRVVFPGREIAAALLYTHGPMLVELPADLLAAHAPRLGGSQETLGVAVR